MNDFPELNEINAKIQLMHMIAEELADRAECIPALKKNVSRILASLKMLELNITDAVNLSD